MLLSRSQCAEATIMDIAYHMMVPNNPHSQASTADGMVTILVPGHTKCNTGTVFETENLICLDWQP